MDGGDEPESERCNVAVAMTYDSLLGDFPRLGETAYPHPFSIGNIQSIRRRQRRPENADSFSLTAWVKERFQEVDEDTIDLQIPFTAMSNPFPISKALSLN